MTLWNVRSRAQTRLPVRSANALAYTPDGRMLAVAPPQRPLALWNVHAPNTPPRLLKAFGSLSAVAFSPAGDRIAGGRSDGEVGLFDTATLKPLAVPLVGHTGNVNRLAFSPDGSELASAADDGTAILWDARREPRAAQLAGPGVAATAVAAAPNGTIAAARGSEILVWRKQTTRPVTLGAAGLLLDLNLSDDGKTLAASTQDGNVLLAAVPGATRKVSSSDPNVTEPVVGVALSPDGRMLAESLQNGEVRLQATSASHFGPPLPNDQQAPFALDLAFSPDGHTLAAGRSDGTIALWDPGNRRLLGKFRASQDVVRSLAFTPDGKALASASGGTKVQLWNVKSRTSFGEALQTTDGMTAVRFSPDGRLAVAGTKGGAIVLFDVAGRRQLGDPQHGHDGTVFSVAFAEDGTRVVSGGNDGRILLWNVEPWASDQALRDRACSLVGRNLTRSEWNLFLPGKSYRRTCDQWPAGG